MHSHVQRGNEEKGLEGGLEGYRQVRDGSNPKQPMITRIMLKGGMTAIESGLTAGISNPVVKIWYNTVSGAYMDTYAYTNPVSFLVSESVDVAGYDNRWFK